MFRYFPIAFLLGLSMMPSAFGRGRIAANAMSSSAPNLRFSPIAPTTAPIVEAKAFGQLEVRPSFGALDNRVSVQGFAEIGYQFSPVFFLSYVQQMEQELVKDSGNANGMNLLDGFARFQFKNLGIDKENGLSFSLESRVYAPTDPMKRANGYQTSWRNYFMFEKKMGSSWSVFLWEVPILHLYDREGGTSATAGAVANPFFENRLYFGPNFVLFSKKLSLVIPFIFSTSRYQAYAGAANSDSWDAVLWMYPEIAFKLSPSVSIGVAYESGNLLNLGNNTTPAGFDAGTTQMLLNVSF